MLVHARLFLGEDCTTQHRSVASDLKLEELKEKKIGKLQTWQKIELENLMKRKKSNRHGIELVI